MAWGSRWLSFISSFTFSALLPYGFTPVDYFVLRRMLNRDGMNKLSQLSISVSLPFRWFVWDPFPYMLSKNFVQSIGRISTVLRSNIVSRNSFRTAKPQWGPNGLHISAAILAHRRWIIVSMYDLSSTMWCHIWGIDYPILYLRLFKAHLLFSPPGFFCLASQWTLSHFFYAERISLCKLLAKLDCCRILCSFLRGQVVNCSHHSLTMLLSKLTLGAAKPLTRPEEVFPMWSRSATDDGPSCPSLVLYTERTTC
jgi:hypothetical protein